MTEDLDKIWKDDFFERRLEAQLLEQYLESVWKRPSLREDSKGFVLAVDADYGMGKTFFLTGFAKQMAINHPVAYIDAWKDDLQDEPLIAIMATLEEALDNAIEKVEGDEKPKIIAAKKETWKIIKKVSGIIGKGALKKAAGMIITASAAEAVSNIIEGEDEEIQEAISDQIKDIGKDSVEGIVSISKAITSSSKLEERIKDFKEGQNAIKLLKESLDALVKSFNENNIHAPIVIVIDELDRCRPTYAIKLLEEVKHLFDVEGILFVFGINKNQLAKSVNHTYGSDFDGWEYLSRFIDKTYNLMPPKLEALAADLIPKLGIAISNCQSFPIIRNDGREIGNQTNLLLEYIKIFGISARDTIKFLELFALIMVLKPTDYIMLNFLLPKLLKNFANEGQLRLAMERMESYTYNAYRDPYAWENYVKIPLKKFESAADEVLKLGYSEAKDFFENSSEVGVEYWHSKRFLYSGNFERREFYVESNLDKLVGIIGRFD